MALVLGLGNPGPRYARTRHNVGWRVLERLVGRWDARPAGGGDLWRAWRAERSGRAVDLVVPLTFMNASGQAIGPLVKYYQIAPQDLLVVHDDLDLASGMLRLRANGSSGGQNGIKSIIERLGSQDFHRARVGIGRPPGRMDPADYVLHDFSAAEEEVFTPLRQTVCDAIECWLFEGIEAAMNRYNG